MHPANLTSGDPAPFISREGAKGRSHSSGSTDTSGLSNGLLLRLHHAGSPARPRVPARPGSVAVIEKMAPCLALEQRLPGLVSSARRAFV